MSALRSLAEGLGFTDVSTILQSGNLVFHVGGRHTTAQLESRLETEAARLLKLEIDTCVRSASQWSEIIEGNPFNREAREDPGHLVVMCLKDVADPDDVKALQATISGPELIRASRTHLYITYPEGIGRSKLTGTLIEKKLGVRGTARNWNTVEKIAEKLRAQG